MQKSAAPEFEKDAQVMTIRYACGPACDASAWTIRINDQYYFPANGLADGLKVHGLHVMVRYKKTGVYPQEWLGPTNAEIIEVISIKKR